MLKSVSKMTQSKIEIHVNKSSAEGYLVTCGNIFKSFILNNLTMRHSPCQLWQFYGAKSSGSMLASNRSGGPRHRREKERRTGNTRPVPGLHESGTLGM